MLRSHFIFLFYIALSGVVTAQTGYKDTDTEKYTKINIFKKTADTQTKIFYKDTAICKIQCEFIGSTFSSTTIYYITNGKLTQSVYVSLRSHHYYYEERLYFTNDKLVKWENSDKLAGVPGSLPFTDKEKLALHFFEVELNEIKNKVKK